MANKIIFVVPNRMPTEKAYGVTILETAKATINLGIQAEIWCTSNSNQELDTDLIKIKYQEFRKSTFKILEFIFFQINRFRFLNKCISQFPEREIIVWTRDVLGMILILRKTTQVKIALELHHPIGTLDRCIVKFFSNLIGNSGKRVRVFTLSEVLKSRLQPVLKDKFGGLIHMAAPNEFFESNPKEFSKPIITVGYIGKAQSSGISNNLDEILGQLVIELEKFGNLYLKMVGIEDGLRESLLKRVPEYLIENQRVKIIGHVSRDEVLNYLADIDIGLVPYISNAYNDYRFPIKIVEYGSMRCALLFNDSWNLRSLIGSNGVPYQHDSQETLHSALLKLISEPGCLNYYKTSAFEWAKKFTYSRRVEIVLDSF